MTLISCIMITGKSPARLPMARAAVESFLQQTYADRELVVVNDNPHFPKDWLPHDRRIREIRTEKAPLGALRNLGLKSARGVWVVQWDDDDWSHPHRLAHQFKLTEQAGVSASVLLWQVRYSFVNDTAVAFKYDARKGIPGTILHRRNPARYEPVSRHEDSWFRERHFPDALVIQNGPDAEYGPELYLRFWHGSNTWNQKHVMGRMAEPTRRGQRRVPRRSNDYLTEVLRSHYRR